MRKLIISCISERFLPAREAVHVVNELAYAFMVIINSNYYDWSEIDIIRTQLIVKTCINFTKQLGNFRFLQFAKNVYKRR